MKTNLTQPQHKTSRFALVVLAFLTCGFFSNSAFSQVDYFYGTNPSGFRVGAGVGGNWLQDRYRVNPLKPTLNLDVQYNTSEYFSVGFQGQTGTLFGQNSATNTQAQPVANVTNSYTSASVNMRFGVGLLSNFNSMTGLSDALKRFYLGTGLGYISSSNSFNDANLPVDYEAKHQSSGVYMPFNLGTTIDMRKLTHSDRLEFNPEYQFNVVSDRYLEGFNSIYAKSNLQYYSQLTLSIRYKF